MIIIANENDNNNDNGDKDNFNKNIYCKMQIPKQR